jgi:hypothetical protein
MGQVEFCYKPFFMSRVSDLALKPKIFITTIMNDFLAAGSEFGSANFQSGIRTEILM